MTSLKFIIYKDDHISFEYPKTSLLKCEEWTNEHYRREDHGASFTLVFLFFFMDLDFTLFTDKKTKKKRNNKKKKKIIQVKYFKKDSVKMRYVR